MSDDVGEIGESILPRNDNIIEFANMSKGEFTAGEEFGAAITLPIGAWQTFDNKYMATPNQSTLSIDELVELRKRDGQARALMRLLTLPIRKAAVSGEWVAPEDAKGSNLPEVEFANQMWNLPPRMGGMKVPWHHFLRQILLALIEGYSAFEEVRYIPQEGPLKGKVCIEKMARRDPRTLRFLVDDKGEFVGLKQITNAAGKYIDVTIPPNKVWYYAAQEEENPFYGISYFEAAWYHYDLKKKLYYISHLAAQQAAVPARVGMVPESARAQPKRLAEFKKALADFAFNFSMVAYPGYDVKPFNANTNFNFMALIDHHNLSMSKSVLAKFLDDEQRQVLIENAHDSDTAADFFVMALEAIMAEIAEGLSHFLLPKYIDWNFGSHVYPEYKFGQLTDANKDDLKDLFTAIATAQSSMWTPEFVRQLEEKMAQRFGFDIDYKAIAKREAEEQRQQQEQQAQQQELYQQQLQQSQQGFGGGQGQGYGGYGQGDQLGGYGE